MRDEIGTHFRRAVEDLLTFPIERPFAWSVVASLAILTWLVSHGAVG